jgi:Cu/Ag efflux protein CusF
MKAMTMPFAVPDEERLRQLKSGDQIEARLIRDFETT